MIKHSPKTLRILQLSTSEGIDKAITDIVYDQKCSFKSAFEQLELEWDALINIEGVVYRPEFKYSSYDSWRKMRGRRYRQRAKLKMKS